MLVFERVDWAYDTDDDAGYAPPTIDIYQNQFCRAAAKTPRSIAASLDAGPYL